jgi:hypothetical protein
MTLLMVRWLYSVLRFYTSLCLLLENSRGRRYCSGKLPTGWNTRELDVPRNLILGIEGSSGEHACRSTLLQLTGNCTVSTTAGFSSLFMPYHSSQIRAKPYHCQWTIKTRTAPNRFPSLFKLTSYMTMAIFWEVSPCRLVHTDWRFRWAYSLHHQSGSILTRDAVSSSETSVSIYQTTWRSIPGDSRLHTRRSENQKYNPMSSVDSTKRQK